MYRPQRCLSHRMASTRSVSSPPPGKCRLDCLASSKCVAFEFKSGGRCTRFTNRGTTLEDSSPDHSMFFKMLNGEVVGDTHVVDPVGGRLVVVVVNFLPKQLLHGISLIGVPTSGARNCLPTRRISAKTLNLKILSFTNKMR